MPSICSSLNVARPVGWNEEWAPSFNRNPQTWNAPFKTEGTTELNVMALAGFRIYMLASIRDLNHIKCSSSCSAKYCKKQIPTSSTWIQDVSPLNNPDRYNTFLLESKNRNITFDSISKTAETNDAYHYFPLNANLYREISNAIYTSNAQKRGSSPCFFRTSFDYQGSVGMNHCESLRNLLIITGQLQWWSSMQLERRQAYNRNVKFSYH